MTALRRAGRLAVGVQAALALLAGAATFALVAVTVVAAGSDLLIALLTVAYLAALAAVFRFGGVAYGIPSTVAVLIALDWYWVPPTHPHSVPDAGNLADVLAYLLGGVVIGEIAARSGRRAELSESQRGMLAEEQAALRRVATLVARGRSPAEVFAKVAEEVVLLLGVESAWMHRYEPDGNSTIVASWGELAPAFPVGSRFNLEGENVAAMVRETSRPARIDDYRTVNTPLGKYVQRAGIRSALGSPIVVDGRLWGAIAAVTLREESLPPTAESRIWEFTELVAMAISNVQARSELAASRARIVAATDEERRRVVRDLHDGAQQRLVHTVVTLKLARRALNDDADAAPALISEAIQHAEEATAELRELAHGILPSVLTRGGLRAGVVALASRMPVPVEIGVSASRLPPAVEATAYFMVAEALTNVAKHAHAGCAAVTAQVRDGTLEVQVRDDGVGGARLDGSGLLGLGDRLSVLDGSLRVDSPANGGTLVSAVIPFQ